MESSSDRVRRAWEIVADLAVRGAPVDASVTALAALGADAVEALEDAAALDDARVVDAAIAALSQIARAGVRAAIAPLLNTAERLAADGKRCARSLRGAGGALLPRDAERLRPLVHRFAHHIDADVRIAAAELAARLEDAGLVDVLDGLVRDPVRAVAEAALKARGVVGAQTAVPLPPGDPLPEIVLALSSAEPAGREAAVSRLVTDPEWRGLLGRLLQETSGLARVGVLEAFARLAEVSLARDLFALVLDQTTADRDRALALRAIEPGDQLDAATLDAALERFGASADPFVRGHAGALAVRAATRRSLAVATWVLGDSVAWVRETVAVEWSRRADRARSSMLDRVAALLSAGDPMRPAAEDVAFFRHLLDGVTRLAEAGVFVDSATGGAVARWLMAGPGEVAAAARRAVEALGRAGRSVVAPVDAVRAALTADATVEQLRGATLAAALGPADVQRLEPELIALVRRADPAVLAAIAPLFGQLTTPRANEAAAWLRTHADGAVRTAAGATE
jgi:hypothetical protein